VDGATRCGWGRVMCVPVSWMVQVHVSSTLSRVKGSRMVWSPELRCVVGGPESRIGQVCVGDAGSCIVLVPVNKGG
jgi:hypothetical protein